MEREHAQRYCPQSSTLAAFRTIRLFGARRKGKERVPISSPYKRIDPSGSRPLNPDTVVARMMRDHRSKVESGLGALLEVLAGVRGVWERTEWRVDYCGCWPVQALEPWFGAVACSWLPAGGLLTQLPNDATSNTFLARSPRSEGKGVAGNEVV